MRWARWVLALAGIDHHDEQPLFPEALPLAADLGHPVCDAVYSVAAQCDAATLLSFGC